MLIGFAHKVSAQTFPCYKFETHDSIVGSKVDTIGKTRVVKYDTTEKKSCLFLHYFCKVKLQIDSTVSYKYQTQMKAIKVSVTHDSLENCACTETTMMRLRKLLPQK